MYSIIFFWNEKSVPKPKNNMLYNSLSINNAISGI